MNIKQAFILTHRQSQSQSLQHSSQLPCPDTQEQQQYTQLNLSRWSNTIPMHSMFKSFNEYWGNLM
jgi:hypothetical protein